MLSTEGSASGARIPARVGGHPPLIRATRTARASGRLRRPQATLRGDEDGRSEVRSRTTRGPLSRHGALPAVTAFDWGREAARWAQPANSQNGMNGMSASYGGFAAGSSIADAADGGPAGSPFSPLG